MCEFIHVRLPTTLYSFCMWNVLGSKEINKRGFHWWMKLNEKKSRSLFHSHIFFCELRITKTHIGKCTKHPWCFYNFCSYVRQIAVGAKKLSSTRSCCLLLLKCEYLTIFLSLAFIWASSWRNNVIYACINLNLNSKSIF
jgi:uncharacterized membrane protein